MSSYAGGCSNRPPRLPPLPGKIVVVNSSVHLRVIFNFQFIGDIRFGSSDPFLLVLTASLRKVLEIRSEPKNISSKVSFHASRLKLERKSVLMILLSAYFFILGHPPPNCSSRAKFRIFKNFRSGQFREFSQHKKH